MKTVLSISVLGVMLLNGCAKPIDACFEIYPANIDTTITVIFDATCSENASSYDWNFGDGTGDTTSNDLIVFHRYKKPGTYKVRLNAQRKSGVTVRKENPITEQFVIVK